MESRLIRGLYCIGEVVDVDAFTGGYNLQAAFSMGYAAGVDCVKNKCNIIKYLFSDVNLCYTKLYRNNLIYT